ncbi:hypothetical protein Taro_049429 [Colocasia esculenta]|uniref:AAA+ ATPase domain-containing protein n=1 Tax=Colocasia esculenta TaxID=4460 RepID=A0A843XAT9_COLES|nr:hypothetical protein [Colocasia esculenta]
MLLGNNDVKIVGIYDMPGIGKTTLLQKIYHELRESNQQGGGDPSKAVIYVNVHKEPNIGSLQRDIAQQLCPIPAEDGPSDAPSPEIQQARTLFMELSKNESILLLDDVWEALDWKKIGITSPSSERVLCKIIFTTPLRQVCIDMEVGANSVGIGFLSDTQSWELFCHKVNKLVDDPSITPERAVVTLCGGLPRAIITMSDYY